MKIAELLEAAMEWTATIEGRDEFGEVQRAQVQIEKGFERLPAGDIALSIDDGKRIMTKLQDFVVKQERATYALVHQIGTDKLTGFHADLGKGGVGANIHAKRYGCVSFGGCQASLGQGRRQGADVWRGRRRRSARRRVLINPVELKPDPALPEAVWDKLLSLSSQTLPKRHASPVKRLTSLAHELAVYGLLVDAGKAAHAEMHKALNGIRARYKAEIEAARKSVLTVEGKSLKGGSMSFDDFLEEAALAGSVANFPWRKPRSMIAGNGSGGMAR